MPARRRQLRLLHEPDELLALGNSVHTFVVKASDALHNGPPSPPYTWSVDTVAPETTITMTPDAGQRQCLGDVRLHE